MKSNHKQNQMTEIVFLLDCSGSMAGYEEDTIGGFNAMLARQRAKEGRAYVTTVLFDNHIRILHDRIPIERVAPMTREDYRVGGCTALLDAIGSTIRHIGSIHKYARPADVPAHTIFLITTDGLENASREYDRKTVKAQIARQQERYGWEFLFLAANIDAGAEAEGIGIRRERAVNYCQTGVGVQSSYHAMADAILAVRSGEDLDHVAWKQAVEDEETEGKA